MKNRIVVLGVGTAGITSLCHLLAFLPEDWQVFSIYDPETPILGIGESTTTAIPTSLYLRTGFTLLEDRDQLDATVKNGVKYTGWREQNFFSKLVPPGHGIHFNNFRLKDFAFESFSQRWGDKFQIITGKISSLENSDRSATVIMGDEKHKFDWVVDCRGYPEDYSDYIISNVIPVNHCLVHMIPEAGEWPWTYHTAHRNGWMFGIPLTTRQGWGYLYNDTITERRDAEDDIRERFDIGKKDLQLREFAFKNYYAKHFLEGRILKNGNRALFYEPIEAMSGFFYDQVMRHFYDLLQGSMIEEQFNSELTRIAEDLETFIAYIYHGGSNYDSDFWKITSEKCRSKIENDQRFNWYVSLLKELTPSQRSEQRLYGIFNSPNWFDFDRNLGYHLLTAEIR